MYYHFSYYAQNVSLRSGLSIRAEYDVGFISMAELLRNVKLLYHVFVRFAYISFKTTKNQRFFVIIPHIIDIINELFTESNKSHMVGAKSNKLVKHLAKCKCFFAVLNSIYLERSFGCMKATCEQQCFLYINLNAYYN